MLLLRERERVYVLIFRRIEIPENARHVDDRVHIHAMKSAPCERSGAHCTDEIGIGPGGKKGDHRLTVAVFEHELTPFCVKHGACCSVGLNIADRAWCSVLDRDAWRS